METEVFVSANAIPLTTSSSAKDSRRRQYRSCDRCRVGKRACNAEYDSVAEAINNKVACSNCQKKGKTCSFQYVLSILGGLPNTAGQAVVASSTSEVTSDASVSAAKEVSHNMNHNRSHLRNEMAPKTAPLGLVAGQSWLLESSATSSQGGRDQNGTPHHPTDETVTMTMATALNTLSSISPTSSTTRMTSTIDRIFLNDGLIRIYEGAAEHALQCWVTSSNTPYLLSQPSSSTSSSSQQLVYWRICELDRGARTLLGHTSVGSTSREKEIMDAFHSVVLAFAAQWSPRWVPSLARAHNKAAEDKVRLALWERAREQLQKVAGIDSFRVIFALIIFAWTEKPRQVVDRALCDADVDLNGDNCALDTSAWQSPTEGSTFLLVAALRKLLSIKFKIEGKKRRGICPWNAPNGKVKGDGPTLKGNTNAHAEPAIQQSQSTVDLSGVNERKSMAMASKIQSDLEDKRPKPAAPGGSASDSRKVDTRVAANPEELSRMEGTYHMLYWLCVVIDTETSVLRKYPPVVCDEDSEVMSCVPGVTPSSNFAGRKGIWDDYILDSSKLKQHTEFSSSWPCDISKAAATLAFSAPVKVVMFRQISRLQMSFWRRASTCSVEQQIRSGLSIIYHWNQLYGPLIDSCRASHAELPASIQSWYVLLAFPWYLAILLFVEMVQTVDMAGASDELARFERARSGIFPRLRDRACSDLALLITAIQSTSFDHLEPTFEYVRDSGSNLLLTEPWSEILVHSITAVVKTEVKLHEGYCSLFKWKELDESHERIRKCLWALDQLSDRSPSAQMAYEQLEKVSSARRQAQLAFQQIPMASPPLHRDRLAVTSSGSVDGLGGGPSPISDVDSLRANSSLDGPIKSADVAALGFPENALAQQQDLLQSAIDTYFAFNPTPEIQSMPVDDLGTSSGRDTGISAVELHPGNNPSEDIRQTRDYLHLLEVLEQAKCGQSSTLTSSLRQDIAALPGAEFSIQPLSILETLERMTNQPMRDLLTHSSDSSASSLDTAFSFDSAVGVAGECFVDLDTASNAASRDVVMINSMASVAHLPASWAATSVTSCSTDTESESSDHHGVARKKHKSSHQMQVEDVSFTSAQPPLPYPLHALQDAKLKHPDYRFTSLPLQSPALFHRKHDDLYTDDDDDELVTYRANLSKRKRSVSSTSCDSNALRAQFPSPKASNDRATPLS